MKELLETIARGLVVNKDGVTVTVDEPNEENVVVYHLHVARRIWAESSASRAGLPRRFG